MCASSRGLYFQTFGFELGTFENQYTDSLFGLIYQFKYFDFFICSLENCNFLWLGGDNIHPWPQNPDKLHDDKSIYRYIRYVWYFSTQKDENLHRNLISRITQLLICNRPNICQLTDHSSKTVENLLLPYRVLNPRPLDHLVNYAMGVSALCQQNTGVICEIKLREIFLRQRMPLHWLTELEKHFSYRLVWSVFDNSLF